MKNKLHLFTMIVVFAILLAGALYVHQAVAAEDCDGYRPYPVYPWCWDDPEPLPTATPTPEPTVEPIWFRWFRWFPIFRP